MNISNPADKIYHHQTNKINATFSPPAEFVSVAASTLFAADLMRFTARLLLLIGFGVNILPAIAGNLNNTPLYSQVTINVMNTSTGLGDKTVVGFNPNSTDTFNPVYDANKLQGAPTRETLYTLNSGEWMAINTLPCEATTDTVAMGFEAGTNGNFNMSFTGLSSFDSTCYIYLEDKQTQSTHNLRNGDYSFQSKTTDDPNRFLLHFTPPLQIAATDSDCAATTSLNIQQPGIAEWNYTLVDSGTDIIINGTLSQTQPITLQVAPGVYFLTVTDSNNYQTTKTFQVTAAPQVTSAAFQLAADSVQTGQNIILSSTDTGIINNQWNFGNGTFGTAADTTINYTVAGAYTLTLTVTNQSGCNSTLAQTVFVTPVTTTGLTEIITNESPDIWSHNSKVYVNFTSSTTANANIAIYNVLGQALSNEHFAGDTIYEKEISNITAGYVLVSVNEAGKVSAKKLLISNNK